MIAFLRGQLRSATDDHVIIDVGGVGYQVSLARHDLDKLGALGEIVTLEIYTHVTDSVIHLFGFSTVRRRQIFRKLISVSGVGPKSAITILGGLSDDDLVRAILEGDVVRLSATPGIGKKTAERLITELKDKFKEEVFISRSGFGSTAVGDPRIGDALQALVSLGYPELSARKALQQIGSHESDTVQNLIKKSLGVLAR